MKRPNRYPDEVERIVVACRAEGKSIRETCAWLRAIGRQPQGRQWHERTVARILARHRFKLAPAVHSATRRAARRRVAGVVPRS